MTKPPLSLGLALLLIAGCSSDGPPAIDTVLVTPALSKSASAGSKDLVVYTQNVYPGANLDIVFNDPTEAHFIAALQQFAATNWPERAAAIARFVDQQNPDVIALNEVSTVKVSGFDALDTDTDFLAILLNALDSRGLHYVVAGKVANLHPVINLGGPVIDWQDYDVVLTRRGIGVGQVQTGNYAFHVPVDLGGLASFELLRGYVIVDLTDGGRAARFAASHLEDLIPGANAAQSAELIEKLASSPEPVVIASDLNTNPADPATWASYRQFRAAGFQDAWLARAGLPHANGFTCCESDAVLRNPAATLTTRIDLVLVHPEGRGHSSSIRPVDVTIVGDQLNERTATGMWPSDHAGVIARLEWKKIDRK